jgi:flagellar hook-basal body complex protein FliE
MEEIVVNGIQNTQGISSSRGISGSPEVQKSSAGPTANAFSEVLNSVLTAAAKIQDETAKSIETIPGIGVGDIKVEMAKAGDAMQRMQDARDKLLSAYKTIT